jgi:hypothetical protein
MSNFGVQSTKDSLRLNSELAQYHGRSQSPVVRQEHASLTHCGNVNKAAFENEAFVTAQWTGSFVKAFLNAEILKLLLRVGFIQPTVEAKQVPLIVKLKLGSSLGPFAAEYRGETGWNTQNKPKRDSRLVHRLLVRDQGVGGSNPLSPDQIIYNKQLTSLRFELYDAEAHLLFPIMHTPATTTRSPEPTCFGATSIHRQQREPNA